MGTVHGEDLPYVFGAPLVDGFSHFPRNYTKSEVALSEALMIFWSNFARTGNPNEHHRQDQVLLASKERNRFRSIVWDEYDPVHQKYLEIGEYIHVECHSSLILAFTLRISLQIQISRNCLDKNRLFFLLIWARGCAVNCSLLIFSCWHYI